MRVCPNCRSQFDDQTGNPCEVCGWSLEMSEGIPVYFSNADREDRFFSDYVTNYKELSEADLQQEIVDKTYLNNQAEKLVSYLEGQNFGSILEVGVGQGFFLRKLREHFGNSRVTAVDISVPFLKHLKTIENVECIVANAENLPFKEEYDLVVASDILEHVINPIDFLLSVNFSLRSHGVMVLRVPFEDNMLQYSKLLGCKYKFAHLRNFSDRNLSLLLNQAGFEIERTHYDGYYFYRRRSFFWRGWRERLLESALNAVYPSVNDVTKIPNWLGWIVMKPLEIVVIARKSKTITSMNSFF